MRIKLKTVGGHLKDQVQPGFEQLRRLLTAFPAGERPNLDGFSLFHSVQAEIIGGQTWYSSVFPCNAFLLMFRDMLQMTGAAVCTCTVCGDYFCGKAGDDCCGNPDCKKYLESTDPYQKQKDLSSMFQFCGIRSPSTMRCIFDMRFFRPAHCEVYTENRRLRCAGGGFWLLICSEAFVSEVSDRLR